MTPQIWHVITNKNCSMFWAAPGWVRFARNAKRYTTHTAAMRSLKIAQKATTAPLKITTFDPELDWYVGDED